MRAFILPMLFIMALAFLAGLWLPWWIIAVVAALVCFIVDVRRSFGTSFLAGLLLWGGMAFFYSQRNEGILSEQIADLFMGLSGLLQVLLTGLIGGLAAGLGGYAGRSLRELLTKEP
jgi:hypothetical protein